MYQVLLATVQIKVFTVSMFFNLCRELGIGMVCYGPLGRGFFVGRGITETIPENSFLVCTSISLCSVFLEFSLYFSN